jgi:hypothetical protein
VNGPGATDDAGGALMPMSLAEEPEVPHLVLVEPDEALDRARPVPPKEQMHLVDFSDEEWDAFCDAMRSR